MLILLELSSGNIFKSVFILLNLIFTFAILNDLDFFPNLGFILIIV